MTVVSTAHRSRDIIRLLQCRSHFEDALTVARSTFGDSATVTRLVERSVLGSWSISGDHDGRAAIAGILDAIRSRSLIGKITGWRRVPVRTPVLEMTDPVMASWTQEGSELPVGAPEFVARALEGLQVGAIVPITKQLLQAVGNADAEHTVSRDLVRALADTESGSLIDPNNAGIAGESPASLLHGITPVPSSGSPADDLAALVEAFDGDLETAVLISHPAVALQLHAAGFEGAGARGGDVAGIPLFTSSAVPRSSDGTLIALIDPGRVLLVDDGIDLGISTESTLRVGTDSDDNPEFINLWQMGLIGVRAVRQLNWVAMGGAAAYVSGVDYGSGS